MPLVGSREMLYRAMEERYAIGAFNISSLDMIWPIVEAAEAERAPIILQTAPSQIDFMRLDLVAAVAKAVASAASVPIALHLDHGADYQQNVACLRAGYTSLMYDGSSKPYAENVATTSKIVELAHAVGVGVEAELGAVLRIANCPTPEEVAACLTQPEEAQQFVEATGVDYLAVAVGTVHNMIVRSAKIDLPRIAALRAATRRPLALHGGSGVPHEVTAEAVQNGICKINVSTELVKQLRLGMENAYAENPAELRPAFLMPSALALVREAAAEKIRLFGSAGKA
jgi:fructose-bisphosphate aldolase, class II